MTASTLTVGTRAVDRAKLTKTGTNRHGAVHTVTVDGTEVGRVYKISASLWGYEGGPIIGRSKRADVVAIVVARAVEAGTITDLDAAARTVADAAAAQARITDPTRDDERTRELLREAAGRLALRPGIREGDLVLYGDGTVSRVSVAWAQTANHVQAQPVADPLGGGSVHLSGSGTTSFSGGCGPAVPVESLTDTGETRLASAWIWWHGIAGGGRGVQVLAPFRVFRTSKTSPRG